MSTRPSSPCSRRRARRDGRGAIRQHDRRSDAGRHADLPGRQRHGDEARRRREGRPACGSSGTWASPKPATSKVNESPKIAILTTNGTPTKTIGPTTYVTGADTDGVLKILFGADAQYVGTTGGPNPLSNPAIDDPLAGFDVIDNAGAAWPARPRLSRAPPQAPRAPLSRATRSRLQRRIPAAWPLATPSQSQTSVWLAYNGSRTVKSVVSGLQFTYTNPTTGLANSGRAGP